MESGDSDSEIYIAQSGCHWQENNFSDDSTSEELFGILPNPDLDVLDTAKDESKEVTESRFTKPVQYKIAWKLCRTRN